MKHNTLLRFHDGSESSVAQAIERQECRPGMTIKPARDYRALRQLKRRKRREAILRVGLAVFGWLALTVMVLAFVAGVILIYIAFAA